MKRFIWAGLALQLCALPGFAQTTPSSPPVTTPPPPAVHPPTGGPSTPPMTEPANAIEKSGVTPGANSFTETQAQERLKHNGYTQVSTLTKDSDGIWRGSATKNGAQTHVAVDFKGNISTN
jgi:hypothetical protein